MKTDVEVSKFMSLVLRHQPEQAGLTLDNGGWANFEDLAQCLSERFGISTEDVVRVVNENPKKRFVLEGNRIRAAQGHSVTIELGLQPVSAPETLFHGTKLQFIEAILRDGLTKQARHHVHLSPDVEGARSVADRRKGVSLVFAIHAGRMAADGRSFYRSENGVWLTDSVPPSYLSTHGQPGEP